MRKWLKNYLFPAVLLLYPFWNVNEGVDLMDVGYNYGNFVFWDQLGNTWKLGTYLANELGRFFYRLPMGDTMLGMNIYTTCLISIMAFTAYWFARRYIPAGFAFLGNILAVNLCWCPTAKLYDYLTYLLMMAGILILYLGLNNGRRRYLVLAGGLLGVNLFTRFSNLTEAGFILLVWYEAWAGKKGIKEAVRLTVWCLLGYGIGIALMLVVISSQFGIEAYISMIEGMLGIEATASQYSALDLLTGAWKDYFSSIKWIALYAVYILAGTIFFRFLFRRNAQESAGKLEIAARICYLSGMAVLYRFFWGRGMFDLNYYSYGVMFWPAVIFLVWSLSVCAVRLIKGNDSLAMLVLLVLLLTPLGSNNKSYSIMNNLFLTAPFILYWSWEILRSRGFAFQSVAITYFIFLMVQTTGFGLVFTFGDGSYEQKRDTKIEKNGILNGIYTSEARAEAIENVTAFVNGLPGKHTAVTYGNIPSLCYYLGIEPAMGSTWPDLDSYAMQDFKQDLILMEKQAEDRRPIIILNAQLDEEDRLEEKYLRIEDFMDRHNYRQRLAADNLLVFY